MKIIYISEYFPYENEGEITGGVEARCLNIAKRLSNLELTIEVQVGEEDKMFGSISSNDIHKSITSKGFEINQDSINLEKPIKALGIYKIDINVTKKIKSTVKVYVIKS